MRKTDVTAYCLLIHDRFIEYAPLTREIKKLVNVKFNKKNIKIYTYII